MTFLAALVSIEAAGTLVTFVISRLLKYRLSFGELLGLAFFIGLGSVAYLQFVVFLFGAKLTLGFVNAVTVLTLIISIPLLFKSCRQAGQSEPRAALGILEKIILLLLFLQAAAVVLQALPVPINSYDSLANFGFKAKIFYLNQGIPADFFKWSEYAVSHPDYPPLLPLVMTWIYYFIGLNDTLVTKIMPAAYLVFLPVFYLLLRKFFMRLYALVAVLVFATIPQVSRYAIITYADLLLGIFVAVAFMYFMLYLRDRGTGHLVFSALFFGLSAWVKNESVVFICVFFLLLTVYLFKLKDNRRLFRHLLLASCVFFIASAPWMIFKLYNGLVNSDINIGNLGTERLLINLKDSWFILYNLQMEFFNFKKWNIFWLLVILVFFLKRKNIFKGIALYAAFFIIIASTGYFCAYLAITRYSVDFYVEKTLSRFMLHFCGLYIFLCAYLLQDRTEKL